MSVAVQEKILGLLYDQWFKDYVLGASLETLVSQLNISDVEVYQALDILQTSGLVQRNKINWYVITAYGIDKFEENFLPATELSRKKQERKSILQLLLDLYEVNPLAWVESANVKNKVEITNHRYLAG